MSTRLVRTFVPLVLVAATAVHAAAAFHVVNAHRDLYIAGAPIPLPDVNAGDVVVAGAAIFVGQGASGAGQQSILRVNPDGSTTTVVSNLNALGGLAYDGENDRLLFTDGGGDLAGATSGDTVYALPNPRAVGAPIDAATLTILPSGSIPYAQAVLALPGGDVLVGDPAGPGAGRVVKLSGMTATNFIAGLDYVAGLSLVAYVGAPGQPQIFVGNVDGSSVGAVQRYSLLGAALGTLNQTPLSGAHDQAAEVTGNMYLTGDFTEGGDSRLVELEQSGFVEEIAAGFGLSSGIAVDGPSQEILVLDAGAPRIDRIIAVLSMTPGGSGKRECQVEEWGGPYDVQHSGKISKRWTCHDGDPACDRDLAANGTCVFAVGECMRVNDHRLPQCAAVDIETVTVTSTSLAAAASAVQAAVNAVLPATAPTCSETTLVSVPADKRARSIKFAARAGAKRLDSDTLNLRCLP